jgi:hypothetical protein
MMMIVLLKNKNLMKILQVFLKNIIKIIKIYQMKVNKEWKNLVISLMNINYINKKIKIIQ